MFTESSVTTSQCCTILDSSGQTTHLMTGRGPSSRLARGGSGTTVDRASAAWWPSEELTSGGSTCFKPPPRDGSRDTVLGTCQKRCGIVGYYNSDSWRIRTPQISQKLLWIVIPASVCFIILWSSCDDHLRLAHT